MTGEHIVLAADGYATEPAEVEAVELAAECRCAICDALSALLSDDDARSHVSEVKTLEAFLECHGLLEDYCQGGWLP